jgi:hypothetical protein
VDVVSRGPNGCSLVRKSGGRAPEWAVVGYNVAMSNNDLARAQRAEERRRTWRGGVARSFEEMDDIDLDFWLAMSPEDRLRAMWSVVEDVLALQGENGPPPRLQRSVGGIRARKG